MVFAVPLALVVGLIGEAIAAVVLPGARRRRTDRSGLGQLVKDAGGERASVVEAGGALAALLGAGVAAGGAVGLGPGSGALVYLGLVASAVGTHVAAAASDGAGRERLRAALIEPVFVVALGAMFVRWGAADLDAVRGTQAVLGPGVALRPVTAAAGLALAALVALASGGIRVASRSALPGAPALLMRLARWSAIGATALVVATLVAGSDLGAARIDDIGVYGAAALLAAVVGAVSDAVLRVHRLRVTAALLVAATASVVLVAV
ncbi:MAG TPA: hypothetical protein VG602_04580 [Actinomycetota bacterium]|nr:hypothetical protein [Actinomycetota bacterium]